MDKEHIKIGMEVQHTSTGEVGIITDFCLSHTKVKVDFHDGNGNYPTPIRNIITPVTKYSEDQFLKIGNEIERCFKWECPCCGEEIVSNDCDSENDFLKQLFDSGVRFKSMASMQGVFCKECYTDYETQNSSL